MAEKSDLVINHFELLYKHRILLAEAFHRGTVDAAVDPDGGRGIARLNHAGILRPYLDGTYRLASSLADHLDEVLNIERLYSSAGSDLVDLFEHLPDIVSSVDEAAFQGDSLAVDRGINDFDRRIFEITDSITGTLQLVRVQAENNFANVKGYAEKRKQNEFYLERVTRLGETLGTVQSADLMRSLEASPERDRLIDTYRSQIADHLPQWRANLLDITKILKDYLFRTRQIERTARRMRSFELFLRHTPGYVPPEIECETEPPLWACHAAALTMVAHVDVHDSAGEEFALEIARLIPDIRPVVEPPPRLGALLPDEPIEIDADPDKEMFWEIGVARMLDSVGPEVLSATAWKSAHAEYSGIEDDIWLLCLLHEEEKGWERNANIRFEHITLPTGLISGNILLADIQLSRPDHAQ